MQRKSRIMLATLGVIAVPAFKAQAATVWWTGDQDANFTTNNSGNTNWATDNTGTTDLGALPGSADIVDFYAANANTGNLNVAFPATGPLGGLILDGSSSMTFGAGGSNGISIQLGSGGVNVASGAGQLIFATRINPAASATWTNNSNSNIVTNFLLGGNGNTASLTLAAGTLEMKNTLQLLGGVVINNGACLQYDAGAGSDRSYFLPITDNGTLNVNGNTVEFGYLGGSGVVSNSTNTLSVLELDLGGNKSTTFSGSIIGKQYLDIRGGGGAGTLTFTGTSTYSGGFTIIGDFGAGGVADTTLVLGAGTNLLPSGATMYLGGGVTPIKARLILGNANGPSNLSVAGLSCHANVGTNGFIFGGSSSISTLTNTAASDANYLFHGIIGGSGTNQNNVAYTQSGNFTFTLFNSNSYVGMTTINNGTILAANDSALGSATATTAGLTMGGAAATVNFNSASPAIASLAGTFTTSRLNLGNGTNSTATTLTVGGNGVSTSFAGIIADAGASAIGNLVKTGTGTLALTGNSTYSGTTTVTGGILSVPSLANQNTASPIGKGSAGGSSADLVLAGGALQYTGSGASTDRQFSVGTAGGTLDASGTGSVNFANTAPIGFNSQSGARTLTLAGSSTFSNTLAAQVGDNGGSTSLAKTGAGLWIINNSANSYSGGTSVTGGTLDVTGTLVNSAAITVDSTSAAANLVLDNANALPASATITGQNTGTLSFSPSVTVNSNQTFASLSSVGPSTFTTGTSSITTVGGTGSLNVASPATLNVTGSFNHGSINSDGSVNISGGTLDTVGPVNGMGTLAVSGGSNLSATYIRHGGLSVGAGSTVTITHDDAFTTGATPTHTSAVTTLAVDAAGTLDITNNGLVVYDTTQFGAIQSSIVNASHNRVWDQPGITSSTAAANNGDHAVGYAQGSTLPNGGSTSFNGFSFTDAVIVRYTLIGDTNLKGSVDLSDYSKVVQNFGKSPAVWSDGNFDYTGTVGLGDYTKVVLNFGRTDSTALNNTAGPSAQQVKASSAALTLKTAAVAPSVINATDVTLTVNLVTGNVTLISAVQSPTAVITAYTVKSPSGSLIKFKNSATKYLGVSFENNPNVFYTSSNSNQYHNWTGIKNTTTVIGEGFGNSYTATNDTTWTNYTLPSNGYALGKMFLQLTSGGVADLSFQWDDASLNTYTSVVNYVGGAVPEPTSVSLLAMGAVGLLGRRRRHRSN